MKKLLTVLLILTAVSVTAERLPDAKFRRLDTRDGLSNSQVNCVLRDSRGFVWIGTSYGLNRYDGYRFKTFYANMRDTTTLRDNVVSQIYEAYDGKLWMQLSMNYCVYDPVTERFERNISRELAKFGIEGSVERLYIDKKKNFWVKLYDKGFVCYNPYTKERHEFKSGYGPQEVNPDYSISTFADLGKSLLFVTNDGVIVCLNGEKGQVSWKSDWMKRNGSIPNQEYRIYIDRESNIYVVNYGMTFIFMQKEKRWYKSLQSMLRARGIEGLPENLMIWNLLRDRHGLLWVTTDHDGLFAFDMENHQYRQYLHDKFDTSTLSDNTLRGIYEDPDGQIWIGSYRNGANQINAGNTYAKCVELGDINSVAEDHYGNYWIGTNDRGIIVYNPNSGEELQHYTTANSGLGGNIMVGATCASDGSIWFGSYNGGLTRCIPTGNKAGGEAVIVNYHASGQPGDLANSSVWSVTEDKWHRIWVGLLGGGIQMLDLKTGKFRTWDTSNTQIPGNYVTSASWTKKGWLMVGTSYYWCLVNPVKGRLVNQVFPGAENLSSNTGNTVCVIEDSRGLIWQGSVSGLCIHDPKTQQLKTLDMTNGLYGSSVCSITEDQQHVIWCVTDHGVSRIIPQQDEETGQWQFIIRSFNQRDGLQRGTYNQRSSWLTRDGRLLIGGQGGLDIITPKNISNSTGKECPVFSGLLIYDEEVEVGRKFEGRIILDKALNKSRSLSLRYSENNFTIQLGSNAGNALNDKRFVYKLEGFRDSWSKTAENNPNISFMSLHSGDYTLRVRMLNDDGTMGEHEAVLDIHIGVPFWRSIWANLCYLLIIGVIAYFWRRRFLRKQADRMRIEQLRRETEKAQWMHEMKAQMMSEQKETPVAQESPAATEDAEATGAAATEAPASTRLTADLVSFVRSFCNNYQLPADKQLQLQFLSLTDTLPVAFEPVKMERALRILIDNSVNFSPSDGRIKVLVDLVGNKAEIRIADNGYGIPEEAKPYMFAPPVADADSIGLHEVKQIVEAFGGSVRADDNKPHGTVFFITLPTNEYNNGTPVEDAVVVD